MQPWGWGPQWHPLLIILRVLMETAANGRMGAAQGKDASRLEFAPSHWLCYQCGTSGAWGGGGEGVQRRAVLGSELLIMPNPPV